MRSAMLNAFTVDVEDYFQVQAFERVVRRSLWDEYESRVVSNTQRLLDILGQHEVRGTFFVLGWVADRFPQTVREIQGAGHEIGCHSYWHRMVSRMTPEAFRQDLRRATEAIGAVTGKAATSFRAPSFSITRESLWALDILIEEGYRRDSSIFPVYHDRYGIPEAARFPHVVDRAGGTLQEFPPSVSPLGPINVPVAGGGYFRLYPTRLLHRCLHRINCVEHQPFLFYLHPWELDPDQPRLPGPRLRRYRHYLNLKGTESKLHRLLRRFRFAPMGEVLSEPSRVLRAWRASPVQREKGIGQRIENDRVDT